jgi:hypothetical protein
MRTYEAEIAEVRRQAIVLHQQNKLDDASFKRVNDLCEQSEYYDRQGIDYKRDSMLENATQICIGDQ